MRASLRVVTIAYHDGVEHYVTAFKFLGGGGQFGTLIPLPAVPTQVERGGAWTLQRLVRETQPRAAVRALAAVESPAGASAEFRTTAQAQQGMPSLRRKAQTQCQVVVAN